jgi:hypothetical protein
LALSIILALLLTLSDTFVWLKWLALDIWCSLTSWLALLAAPASWRSETAWLCCSISVVLSFALAKTRLFCSVLLDEQTVLIVAMTALPNAQGRV